MGEFTKCIYDRRHSAKDSSKVQSDGGVHFNVKPRFSFSSHRIVHLLSYPATQVEPPRARV